MFLSYNYLTLAAMGTCQMCAEKSKTTLRLRVDEIKPSTCKNLIVVLENPHDWKNIGTVIRNVNALGAEKVYVVDRLGKLPENWQKMRENKTLFKKSASAVKWSFVKRFDDAEACSDHLERTGFKSVVTSPHVKGKHHVSLATGDFTKYKKLAVWFGNEVSGVSDFAVEHSEMCVSIPMYGMIEIESLNLATSTGIVLYEVTKQRRAFQTSKRAKLHEQA